MDLHPEEPPAGPWRAVDQERLAAQLGATLPARRPALVLVDGRSGGGKTTFAGRAARLLGAAVVHTDDLAWQHDSFDWAGLLLDGVLDPWRRGEAVSYRPPAWDRHGRDGSVDVAAGVPLVVEGVGSARAELAPLADLVVWVQSDRALARTRGVARDVELGRSPAEAVAFWDGWMAGEEPFLAAERPWGRAHLVVNGTPPQDAPLDHTLLAGPVAAG